jgi:hypothetical protein
MGISILPYTYQINGVVNTNDSVLSNMEKLSNAAATWISYDMFTGKWGVVINKPEASTANFDDSNILGSIALNVLSLKEMYNGVEVQYPHSDLNGKKDFVRIAIPAEDRLPNEPENILTLNYDLINDPVQAMYIGLIELKQSRLDKTITFLADYSKINIPAGAVISVTNLTFGWTNKLFRIVTVKEISDGEALQTEITALEYDDSVYSTDDLYRYIRTNANGIIPIGAIGQPNPPQVSKFEKSNRPNILIEADVPSGIVSGMEFWLTKDTTVGSDENRSYTLIGTVSGTGGTNLTQGDTVDFNYDALDTGNFYVKVRGINGNTTGPYSEPGGLIEYIPTQVTDAISNADILDQNNDAISGMLTANALLWLLNELMNNTDNTGNIGVITDALGDLFGITEDAEKLGRVLGNVGSIAGGPETMVTTLNVASVVHASKHNAIFLTKNVSSQVFLSNVTLPYTGNYKVRYFINWGGGAGEDQFINKQSFISITGKDLGPWSATGDSRVPKFEDHQVEGFFQGTAGETIALNFGYFTSDTSGPVTDTVVWIIAEVMFVPNIYGD